MPYKDPAMQREANRRYGKSEKGKAARRRYEQSEKGREINRAKCRRFYERHIDAQRERVREYQRKMDGWYDDGGMATEPLSVRRIR